MLDTRSPIPYWRLSGFYLFYFASLGALVPYWGLYLRSQGFDAIAIGEVMATIMATKIVAPYLWGWVADHTGRHMGVVRYTSLLAWLCFIGVFWHLGYLWIVLVMALFSFFWNASLPQFEAVTLNYLADQHHRYSHIRLWGSVGFIITVAGLGVLLGRIGMHYLPYILMTLFSAIWLVSLLVADHPSAKKATNHGSLRSILLRKEVLALFAMCLLIQASHGPYYTFYTIYLEDYGYSRGVIGALWALGVIAEIGVFLIMHRLLVGIGARGLLVVALLLTTIRWIMIGMFPEQFGLLIIAQLLHAASFGLYHAAAIHLVHGYFKGRHQSRGQALYSSVSFGAGGAIGSLYSGYMWEGVNPSATFFIAALLSAVGLLVTMWWLRPQSASAHG